VHHALGVHVGERVRDLDPHLTHLRLRQRAVCDSGCEGGTVDQFHHQERRAVSAGDRAVEQPDQVGVVQVGERVQFDLLALDAGRRVGIDGVHAEDFHGDITSEQFVVRAEHFRHAPGADAVDDPVASTEQPTRPRRGRMGHRFGGGAVRPGVVGDDSSRLVGLARCHHWSFP